MEGHPNLEHLCIGSLADALGYKNIDAALAEIKWLR